MTSCTRKKRFVIISSYSEQLQLSLTVVESTVDAFHHLFVVDPSTAATYGVSLSWIIG